MEAITQGAAKMFHNVQNDILQRVVTNHIALVGTDFSSMCSGMAAAGFSR